MRRVRELLAGFRALPLAGVAQLLQGRVALILAPHPDDESLGCGGLIAAACAAGLAPAVAILTDGAASHPGSAAYPPDRLAKLREAEAVQATGSLGLPAENLHFCRQPDGGLAAQGPGFAAIVQETAVFGERHGCGLVIGPWAGDPHCDHQAAAAIAAAISLRCGWPLLSYPVWGWLRDGEGLFDEIRQAGWRLDISGYRAAKASAIAAHRSQYGDLIGDSPAGFRLPQALLEVFAQPFEVFISDTDDHPARGSSKGFCNAK